MVDFEDRFWRKVVSTGDCLEWVAAKDHSGYGVVKYGSRSITAHRAITIHLHGALPDGAVVMHTCDNPPCVNPEHLIIGTQQDNMYDMYTKGRGLKARGTALPSNKLSEEDVRNIRSLYEHGYSKRRLSIEYNVCWTTVFNIINRKKWRHI